MDNEMVKTKDLPQLPDQKHCYGCAVCRDACPQQAIDMRMDKHGFYYPSVNSALCVSCKLCEKKCPANNPPAHFNEVQEACVAIHKNPVVLEKSASGGAFSAIVSSWNPDKVYGVRWDGFSVVNDEATTETEIRKFSKPKYIISDTNGVYKRAVDALNAGKKVLFSGSPCQIAAFRSYIGKTNDDNLLLVDIVCHGAPSAYLFQLHIDELEDKGKKIDQWSFRDKTPIDGKVRCISARADYADGTWAHFEINEDAYLRLYYSRVAYRESCGNCQFANPHRVSDITICDAHHIQEVYSDLRVEEGVSCILFHTEKGLRLLPEIRGLMDVRDIEYDWTIEHNQQLKHPTNIHPRTQKFYKVIDSGGSFEKAVQKVLKRSVIHRIGSIVKHRVLKL